MVTVKGSDTQTRWYHYDGDNRMVGSHTRTQDVANAAIGGHDGSRVITYNALGQKVKEVRWANTSRKVYYRDGHSQSRQELVKTETLTGYDHNGHLNQVNEFEYAGSQRVKTREMRQRNARMGHGLEQEASEYGYRYWSANGKPGSAVKAEQRSLKDEKTYFDYHQGRLRGQYMQSRSHRSHGFKGQYNTTIDYHYSGQVSTQKTSNMGDGVMDTQAYAYQGTAAFRQSSLSVSTTRRAYGQPYGAGKTQFHYNAAGQMSKVTSTKSERNRELLTDFNGQIALQLSGGQLSAELSTGGNPLAHVSGTIDADLLDDKASATGQQPGSYTVAANDTLARIAQKVYGDSRYWYLLADANGLSPNEALTQGKMLVVPNQHTQTFNGAESFKPYNESEVLGNITPDPIAPPPPKKSCSPVAMIIMVAVAVVVTVYTAGAAAPMVAGMTGGAVGTASGMAAGMAALAGGAGVGMSLGVAVGAATIGGAMGAAASQLVGMAMGEVDEFSWDQVALGGVASAAAAGVGGYLSGASAGAQGAVQGARAQSLTLMQRLGHSAVRSTTAYGTHYLGSKTLGEDASFSWTNLAASVAGHMVGNELSFDMGHEMGNQFTRGMIQSSVSSALRGESWRENAGRFALDAFGNALGNRISRSLASSSSATQRLVSQPRSQSSADDPTVIVTPLSEQDKPQQLHEENLHSGLSEQGAAIDPQQEAQLQALFDEINQVSGESSVFAGDKLCTPSNPLGLTKEQMEAKALSMVRDLGARGIEDLLTYSSQGHQLKPQAKGWAAQRMAAMQSQSLEARLGDVRANSTHWKLAQGVADGGVGLLMLSSPLKLTAAVQGVEVAYQGYQNREWLGQVAMESIDNGGITLGFGGTPSYAIGKQQGAIAFGKWISVDWTQGLELNGGVYSSIEGGANLAKYNLSGGVGGEAFVFTSPNFKGALQGDYQVITGAYNSASVSYIRADNGKINGYQVTKDWYEASVRQIKHDAGAQISYGTGDYMTYGEMYEKLQQKW